MISSILTFLFGCRHPEVQRSWPRSSPGVPTYEVCNGCGKKFTYRKVQFGKEVGIA
jgi:hypothetical protein